MNMKLRAIASIRTNNFKDEQVIEKISTMWEEAYNKLENHQGSVYGVYYDYESNYKGDYSLSVAVEEESNDSGKSFVEIPNDENYEVFKVDAADDQGIFKTWSKIWEQEEAGLLQRAYSYDFEKYYPNNGEIEIYIAIK